MLYELLYPLHEQAEWLSWLNVMRYVPFRAIAAWFTAILMYFLLFPGFLRALKSHQVGQNIREEGPEAHQVKAGTPTMGGSLLLLSIVTPTILWADVRNEIVWLTLALIVALGLIGFADDLLKVQRNSNRGLSGWQKFSLQLLTAIVISWMLFFWTDLPQDWLDVRYRLALPFVSTKKFFPEVAAFYTGGDPFVSLQINRFVYAAFAVVVIVCFSNAVNLTDGLDGLAIGPVLINATTFLFLAYLAGATFFGISLAKYLHIPSIPSSSELVILCASIIGAGVGFLWYNTFPAQVFMGDVGSLSLGGAIGMLALATKNELLSVIIGGIFVLEAASVVTQVVSFKLLGRRVFRMAPLHHHFELKDWAEPKIIVRFWIISVLLALFALSSLKLR
ncbi:MAG: phospho-N-acetylmuramoyl-pentapeptide-transferase [Deltaproteobacteria bacterium]|nr:phospho-N-acetylmuramoyl-pentapeptide-transferase [Deltaproteobacteria bacterium]